MPESNLKDQAVVYIRVASSQQEDSDSIARQREECLSIARERGLTIIREYVDQGRTGHLSG
jgi:DNA invertase Pin-like site-specific DNA recombinase